MVRKPAYTICGPTYTLEIRSRQGRALVLSHFLIRPEFLSSRTAMNVRHLFFYGRRGGPVSATHVVPDAERRTELAFLSNFAAAPFMLRGVRWPTSEHFYQAQKFVETDPDWAEAIRVAPTASKAAAMGRNRAHPVRQDWDAARDAVMLEALRQKFEQNPELRTKLKATGTARLHEDAGARDCYWGAGTPKRRGSDRLGLMLEQVRADL